MDRECKSEIPQVGIFMHRVGEMHRQQLASLANTRCDFDLLYRIGPGTAHANINHIIRRATSKYLAICDDDVEFLDSEWLTTLISVLKENPRAGMVVPVELKEKAQRDAYVEHGWCEAIPKPGYDIAELSWLPGFVMVFDRERTPNIMADENIPGVSQMSDLDLSLQVRSEGYQCLLTSRTAVYHPHKPSDYTWRKQWQIVSANDLGPLHEQQSNYMLQKWGSFYQESHGQRVIGKT